MVHHSIDNPTQFPVPKERHIVKWLTTGVGSVALLALAAHGPQSDPKFDMRNKAQLAAPVVVEHLPHASQEQTNPVLFETIAQDEITGLVVERETQEYAELYHTPIQPGQSEANYFSAKAIEDAVEQVTGGSVQPGTIIETHLDPETGYIISTYVGTELK